MTSYLFNAMAYLSTIPQLTGPNNTVTQYIGGLLDETLVMPLWVSNRFVYQQFSLALNLANFALDFRYLPKH